MPRPEPPTPDLAGFRQAQGRLRSQFGETVVFIGPGSVTFPPGTTVDPDTGRPYDPTIEPTAQVPDERLASATVAFRTAVGEGGDATAIGWVQDSTVMLSSDLTASAAAADAVDVEIRGRRYKITEMRPDGIGGLHRWVTWAKER